MSFLAAEETSKAAADDMVTAGTLSEAHSEVKHAGDTPILMHRERAGETGAAETTNGKLYEATVGVGVAILVRSENSSMTALQALMYDHVDRATTKDSNMRLDIPSVQLYEGSWGRKEVLIATYTLIRPAPINIANVSEFA